MAATLTVGAIESAIRSLGWKYTTDSDGDFKIEYFRKKGKNINIYVYNDAAKKSTLVLKCLCPRWFDDSDLVDIMVFCNNWNRTRFFPKAYVGSQDKDGDRMIHLELALICKSGMDFELLCETIDNFIVGSDLFWDEADKSI